MQGALPPIFAKVVDVHPESNTVDCVGMTDGRHFAAVPVLGNTTGNTGTIDLPVPDRTTGSGETGTNSKWRTLNTNNRDIIAVVVFIEGCPICTGFISPKICQLHMPDEMGKEMKISRHASDVYSWIDKYGNTQWRHPNQTHVGLAGDPSFKDLEGQDRDKKWKIGDKNKPSILSFFFSLINNSTRYFAVKINPWGKTSVSSRDTIKLTATNSIGDWRDTSDDPEAELSLYQVSRSADLMGKDNVTLRSGGGKLNIPANGKVELSAGDSVKIDTGETTVTGDLIVRGDLVVQGTLTVAKTVTAKETMIVMGPLVLGGGMSTMDGSPAVLRGNLFVTGKIASTHGGICEHTTTNGELGDGGSTGGTGL